MNHLDSGSDVEIREAEEFAEPVWARKCARRRIAPVETGEAGGSLDVNGLDQTSYRMSQLFLKLLCIVRSKRDAVEGPIQVRPF